MRVARWAAISDIVRIQAYVSDPCHPEWNVNIAARFPAPPVGQKAACSPDRATALCALNAIPNLPLRIGIRCTQPGYFAWPGITPKRPALSPW